MHPKDKCPLSSRDWVMFLSDEIRHAEIVYYMFTSVIIAASSVLLSIFIATNSMNIRLLNFLSILLILIIYMYIYKKFIPESRKLKKLREKVIRGRLGDSDEICKQWIDIVVSKKEMAEEIRDKEKGKRLPSYRTKLSLTLIIVALLIAPAMLVAPPLLRVRLILFILIIILLFAVACILSNELKNNKKAVDQIDQRFGDVFIGIISGLVASYLTYLAVSLDGISIPLLFFVVPMVFAAMAVGFSLVVVWVFFYNELN
jgi:uncharacterized membrane protein